MEHRNLDQTLACLQGGGVLDPSANLKICDFKSEVDGAILIGKAAGTTCVKTNKRKTPKNTGDGENPKGASSLHENVLRCRLAPLCLLIRSASGHSSRAGDAAGESQVSIGKAAEGRERMQAHGVQFEASSETQCKRLET